jgi:hypothetical protein
MLPVEKSSEFKSGKYGRKSTENQNSTMPGTDLGCVGRRWIRQKAYFTSGYVPLEPGDHLLSQKLLVDVGIDTFADKNR